MNFITSLDGISCHVMSINPKIETYVESGKLQVQRGVFCLKEYFSTTEDDKDQA